MSDAKMKWILVVLAINADSEAIRAYLARLSGAGMTPRTAARRLSAIRQFYRFALTEADSIPVARPSMVTGWIRIR